MDRVGIECVLFRDGKRERDVCFDGCCCLELPGLLLLLAAASDEGLEQGHLALRHSNKSWSHLLAQPTMSLSTSMSLCQIEQICV